jgi:hypothetical protein
MRHDGEVMATYNNRRVTRKIKEMSMPSKPKRNESTEPQSISTPTTEAGQASSGNTTREEEIRRRPYEIFLERGQQPGGEFDDWLKAEREREGAAFSHAEAS